LVSTSLLEFKRILEVLEQRPLSASDVVSLTGLPRYKVLAYMQILEALGFLEKVYSRGTYRVYTLSDLGRDALEVLRTTNTIKLVVVSPKVEEEKQSANVGDIGVKVNEGAVEA